MPSIFCFETDGGELFDTGVCILTGRKIEPGDAAFQVPGTKYFYRVSANALHLHTEDARATILAQVPQDTKSTKKKGSE